MLKAVEVIWVVALEVDGSEKLEVDDACAMVEVVASGDVVVALDEKALVESVIDDVMDVVLVDSEAVLDVVDWPMLVV